MDSSLAAASPLRRKLSVRQNLVALESDDVDQENELKRRRLEAIKKSTEKKRRSVAAPLTAGLNAAQLAKHCQDCIKLSTENKINPKNAFNFLLIDFMTDMAKKMEAHGSFQTVSTALDASVKIYGCRVDAVHMDVMKLAAGALKKDIANNGNSENDGSDHDPEEDPKVKTKKRKRKYTVVAPSTLNAKSETEVLLDAPPKRTILTRGGDTSQLLTAVPKYNDSCLLMVEADVPCWPYEENHHQMPSFSNDVFETDTLLEMFSLISVNLGDQLCEAVSAIEFGADIENDMDFELAQTSVFEFDVNASVQDVEAPVAAPRFAVPMGGYDSGDDIELLPAAEKTPAPIMIKDVTQHLTSANSEYGAFDKKTLASWAGAAYRSWKPITDRSSENKENDDVSQGFGEKRARRARTKTRPVELINCPNKELSKHFIQSFKSILTTTTLVNWTADSVTLTRDYKYNPENLDTLFHLPLRVQENTPEDNNSSVNVENVDDITNNLQTDCVQDQSFDVNENVADVSRPIEEWDDDNLVPVPKSKIDQVKLGIFRKPKYIDVKMLKACIWDVISDTDAATAEDALKFNDLCETCPNRLPKNAAEAISVPIIFNALLHLANEKSLILTSSKEGSGFDISV